MMIEFNLTEDEVLELLTEVCDIVISDTQHLELLDDAIVNEAYTHVSRKSLVWSELNK